SEAASTTADHGVPSSLAAAYSQSAAETPRAAQADSSVSRRAALSEACRPPPQAPVPSRPGADNTRRPKSSPAHCASTTRPHVFCTESCPPKTACRDKCATCTYAAASDGPAHTLPCRASPAQSAPASAASARAHTHPAEPQ